MGPITYRMLIFLYSAFASLEGVCTAAFISRLPGQRFAYPGSLTIQLAKLTFEGIRH